MPFNIFLIMAGYMLASSFTPGPGNILALNTMLKYGFQIMDDGTPMFISNYSNKY